MIVRYILLIKIIVGALILLIANKSNSQVDPSWLKSWNEAVYMQPKNISSKSIIVSKEEPGIPFVIIGQIFKPDGRTKAKSVLIHIYHRDHEGFDFGQNDNFLTTWRLQGWAKTNTEGKFEFRTIRPAPDHLGREGSHIHFTIVSEDFGNQWAPKIHFLDDASIADKEKKESEEAGQFAWLKEVKNIDGIQHIEVKIKLKEKADF